MEFSVETITPDIAHKLLDETERQGLINRSVRPNRVERLAHDMMTGEWQVTHQAIAITDEGAVIDGQHRLHAVMQAGIAVQMLVMRGAQPQSFKVLDTGATRTTGDSLKVAGFNNVNHLAATVRGYLAYDLVMGTNESFQLVLRMVTTPDVFEFMDNPANAQTAIDAVRDASVVANGLARYGLKTPIAIAMMTFQLHAHDVGPTTYHEFFARMTDGANLDVDSPILALRRWFMHDTGYVNVRPMIRRPVAAANTIKSLNDFSLGKPRTLLAFKYGVEPFPSPLAPGTHKKIAEAESL